MWGLTLREAQVIIGASVDRMRQEHNARAWTAWHTAALYRSKKMPKLETLLHGKPVKRAPMSGDQIEASMRTWFGRRGR